MKLELYYREFCPFCRKVRAEMDRQGRTDIELKNIQGSQENLDTLVNVGGMNQVPCLFIDGKPMYESDDIIDWMRANPQA